MQDYTAQQLARKAGSGPFEKADVERFRLAQKPAQRHRVLNFQARYRFVIPHKVR
jgi:hypothetical protein